MGNIKNSRKLNTLQKIDFAGMIEKDGVITVDITDENGVLTKGVKLLIEKDKKLVPANKEDVIKMKEQLGEASLNTGGGATSILKDEAYAKNDLVNQELKDLKEEKKQLREDKKNKTITKEGKSRLDDLDDIIEELEDKIIDVQEYIDEHVQIKKDELRKIGLERNVFHITGILLDKDGNATLEINSPDKNARNLKTVTNDNLIVNFGVKDKQTGLGINLTEDYELAKHNVEVSISKLTNQISLNNAFDKVRATINKIEVASDAIRLDKEISANPTKENYFKAIEMVLNHTDKKATKDLCNTLLEQVLNDRVSTKEVEDAIGKDFRAIAKDSQEFHNLLVISNDDKDQNIIDINKVREDNGVLKFGAIKVEANKEFSNDDIVKLKKAYHNIEKEISKAGFENSKYNINVNVLPGNFNGILSQAKNDIGNTLDVITKIPKSKLTDNGITSYLTNEEKQFIMKEITLEDISGILNLPYQKPGELKIQTTYYIMSPLGPKLTPIQDSKPSAYGGFNSATIMDKLTYMVGNIEDLMKKALEVKTSEVDVEQVER